MKLRVSFKDPDAIDCAIDAYMADLRKSLKGQSLTDMEIDAVLELRADRVRKNVSGFFLYGEYAEVELDFDPLTGVGTAELKKVGE